MGFRILPRCDLMQCWCRQMTSAGKVNAHACKNIIFGTRSTGEVLVVDPGGCETFETRLATFSRGAKSSSQPAAVHCGVTLSRFIAAMR